MTDADWNGYIDAAALALGLSVRPEWRDEVRDNLALLFLQGDRLMAFPLPDEAEAAPIFSAGSVVSA